MGSTEPKSVPAGKPRDSMTDVLACAMDSPVSTRADVNVESEFIFVTVTDPTTDVASALYVNGGGSNVNVSTHVGGWVLFDDTLRFAVEVGMS